LYYFTLFSTWKKHGFTKVFKNSAIDAGLKIILLVLSKLFSGLYLAKFLDTVAKLLFRNNSLLQKKQ